MDRRELLIGGLCLATAAGSLAARPRTRMSLIGASKLERAIPKSFGGWRHQEAGQVVAPQSEDSLAAQLYSQSVGRIYLRGEDEFVMMLLAYGDTQSDTLQLHRPEVCYPAFGFEIRDNRSCEFLDGASATLPGRDLVAANAERTELISYWTRVGNELPTSGGEQRSAKLRSQMAGIIPDGVLARFSTVNENADAAFALNKSFARELLAVVSPHIRTALIGEPLSQRLSNRNR
jgi:EpsI family protein